jgi:hypothetical protein
VWQEYQERRHEKGFSPEVAAAVEQERLGAKIAEGDTSGLRGAVGTPEQIREFLRRYEAAGVDQVIFISQAGNNRHEHIMESLELFGREVLPEFMEREDQAAGEKAKRMEPVVEAVMARRTDDTPPLPRDDYAFPAMPRAWADRTQSPELKEMLEQFAHDRATGKRDTGLGILG